MEIIMKNELMTYNRALAVAKEIYLIYDLKEQFFIDWKNMN